MLAFKIYPGCREKSEFCRRRARGDGKCEIAACLKRQQIGTNDKTLRPAFPGKSDFRNNLKAVASRATSSKLKRNGLCRESMLI
jgi:hypothetical protein